MLKTNLLLECHKERPKVHKDVFGRMSWGKPAPTLTCRCTDVYCGRFVHPDQNRDYRYARLPPYRRFQMSTSFMHINLPHRRSDRERGAGRIREALASCPARSPQHLEKDD